MAIELSNVSSGYSTGVINDNFEAIEAYINDNLLNRDGTSTGEANQLELSLDMNSNFIFNLPEPTLEHQAARLQDVQNALADNAANLITFTPYGNISSENIQGALQELVDGTGQSVDTSTGADQTLVNALDARNFWVTDLAALKAISVSGLSADQKSTITTTGRSGDFVWTAGDQSANVTADPQEGIWVAPDDDATGASGAWRNIQANAGPVFIYPEMFGAVGDGVADDTVALQQAHNLAIDLAEHGDCSLWYSSGRRYKITSSITIDGTFENAKGVRVYGNHAAIEPDGAFAAFVLQGSGGSDRGFVIEHRFADFTVKKAGTQREAGSKAFDLVSTNNANNQIRFENLLIVGFDIGQDIDGYISNSWDKVTFLECNTGLRTKSGSTIGTNNVYQLSACVFRKCTRFIDASVGRVWQLNSCQFEENLEGGTSTWGLQFSAVYNVAFNGCWFERTANTQGAVKFVPSNNFEGNYKFDHCQFSNSSDAGVSSDFYIRTEGADCRITIIGGEFDDRNLTNVINDASTGEVSVLGISVPSSLIDSNSIGTRFSFIGQSDGNDNIGKAGSNTTLSSNGSVNLLGGVTLKWGVTLVSANSTQTVNFAGSDFAASPYNVVANYKSNSISNTDAAGTSNYQPGSVDLTNGADSDREIVYQAIGPT